jgi:hypothetical protein
MSWELSTGFVFCASIVSRKLKHRGLLVSGTEVMKFISLQQALQLPNCAQILQPQMHGNDQLYCSYLSLMPPHGIELVTRYLCDDSSSPVIAFELQV